MLLLQRRLEQSFHRLRCVLHSVRVENYSRVHDQFMPDLIRDLRAVIAEGHALMCCSAKAAAAGSVDPQSFDASAAEQAIARFSAHFSEGREAADLSGRRSEILSESNVGLHACAFGHSSVLFAHDCSTLAADGADDVWARRLDSLTSNFTWKQVTDCSRYFDCSKFTDVEQRRFLVVNSLALLFAFYFGGWLTCVTTQRNAGSASIVSILASSKSVGSAMIRNLSRLEGVVLGVSVGKLVHALTAYCTWYGNVLTILSFFLFLAGSLLLYFHSTNYSYVGCLLAAYGTQMLVTGCVDKVHIAVDASALWSIVTDTIVAIALVSVGDSIAETERPSTKATNTLYEAWAEGLSSMNHMFTGDRPGAGPKAMEAKIDRAELMGKEANNEPRLWDAPWKMSLFTVLVKEAQKMNVLLSSMEWSLADSDGEQWSVVRCQVVYSDEFKTLHSQLRNEINGVMLMLKGELVPSRTVQAPSAERMLKEGDGDYEAIFRQFARSPLGSAQRLNELLHTVRGSHGVPTSLMRDPMSQVCTFLDNASTLETVVIGVAHRILTE